MPPTLNLIVDPGELNVSLSHALPAMTRRISICGDMHYGYVALGLTRTHQEEDVTTHTIVKMYTHMNATDVGLPIPNDTKKAIPESVYGRTDSTTVVTMAKYKDACSCPRCSWTVLPCRTIR